MKTEDINFEPHRGVAIFTIGLSVVFTLVFGTIVVVNVYRQLREPTMTSDFFGWLGTFVVTFACVALLLYFTTAVYRVAFHEAGVIILGLRGRRFFHWSTVRDARLNRFKGNIELALSADGRRFPISSRSTLTGNRPRCWLRFGNACPYPSTIRATSSRCCRMIDLSHRACVYDRHSTRRARGITACSGSSQRALPARCKILTPRETRRALLRINLP